MNPIFVDGNVQLYDAAEVRRTLDIMLPAGQVTELRALDAVATFDRYPSTVSGYFNDADKLIESLDTIRAAKSVYIVANPIDPALLARAANRIRKAGKGETTSDTNIIARNWLLIDCDPQRPSGISSTDSEHAEALERIQRISDTLHFNYGWPEPIAGDSGNGGHLLYAVDLPVDDGGLIQRCLLALDAQFTDAAVKIDTGVFNLARIWKLYGTLACKGDSTADRPHRMSRLISVPDTLVPVGRELLAELASEAPSQSHETNGHRSQDYVNGGFDIDSFIAEHGLELDGPDPYQGGRKWTFKHSPLCEHHGDGPFLIQFASGALSAGCHHDTCSWTWRDLRAKVAPKPDTDLYERLLRNAAASNGNAHTNHGTGSAETVTRPPVHKPVEKFTFAELRQQYPKLNPPVVDGLFREGETVNIISVSKVGKSWLAYDLALSIITGRDWLGRFKTSPGKVIVIDNELHRGTLASRIPAVAAELGIEPAHYESDLEVWPLRGNLRALADLADDLAAIPKGSVKVIILDAKYRFALPGKSENENAAETLLYNLLDQYAALTGAAFVVIHHSSKGDQSGKRITDVGAGAGAQSRAADCHLILREHEEDGVVVLEAAVRSFAPVKPLALRWEFPLWRPAVEIDPAKLKGRLSPREQQQSENDRRDFDKILTALQDGPAREPALRPKTGLKRHRQSSLLDQLVAAGHVASRTIQYQGNEAREYYLPE